MYGDVRREDGGACSRRPPSGASRPDGVAAVIERALGARRMRARYLVGRDARMMLTFRRLLPDLVFDRIVRRGMGL